MALDNFFKNMLSLPTMCCSRLGENASMDHDASFGSPAGKPRKVGFTVPDDCSLKEAFSRLEDGDRLIIRSGTYQWDGQLAITRRGIQIHGEEGTTLVGSLVLKNGSEGSISNLSICNKCEEDGSTLDVMVAEGSKWTIENCCLYCSPQNPLNYANIIRASCDADLRIRTCKFGCPESKRKVGNGIVLGGAARCEAENCLVENVINAVSLYAFSTATFSACRFERSTQGFVLMDRSSAIVRDCVFDAILMGAFQIEHEGRPPHTAAVTPRAVPKGREAQAGCSLVLSGNSVGARMWSGPARPAHFVEVQPGEDPAAAAAAATANAASATE